MRHDCTHCSTEPVYHADDTQQVFPLTRCQSCGVIISSLRLPSRTGGLPGDEEVTGPTPSLVTTACSSGLHQAPLLAALKGQHDNLGRREVETSINYFIESVLKLHEHNCPLTDAQTALILERETDPDEMPPLLIVHGFPIYERDFQSHKVFHDVRTVWRRRMKAYLGIDCLSDADPPTIPTELDGKLAQQKEIAELKEQLARVKQHLDDSQSGMYVNCVYCGHRYGPRASTPVTQAEILKQHIERCLEHPMSKLKEENRVLREWRDSILGLLGTFKEWRDGQWGGDKQGWGFSSEFIKWLYKRHASLQGPEEAGSEHTKADKIKEQAMDFLTERLLVLRFIKIRDSMAYSQKTSAQAWNSLRDEVIDQYARGSSLFVSRVLDMVQAEADMLKSPDDDGVRPRYRRCWYELCLICDAIVSPQEQGRNAALSDVPRNRCPYSPNAEDQNSEVRARMHADVWYDAYDRTISVLAAAKRPGPAN